MENRNEEITATSERMIMKFKKPKQYVYYNAEFDEIILTYMKNITECYSLPSVGRIFPTELGFDVYFYIGEL